MNKRVKKIIQNPLISGSSIIFLGTFFANIFNYGFTLILGRLLPVSDYGLVVSLASIIAIFALFQTSFSNIFAKFSAEYYAAKDTQKLKLLIGGGMQAALICGVVVSLLFMAGAPFLSSFLRINSFWPLVVIGLYILLSFLYALPYGVLQGELKFFSLSSLNITSAAVKIIVGTLFVYLGWGVLGAIGGYLFSVVAPLLLGAIFMFSKIGFSWGTSSQLAVFFKEFRKYSFYFFLASLGITMFNTLDVVVVRNIFDSVTAGQYAALSLIGKSIFYLTAPIYFVFFPLISKKHALKENLTPTLLMASGIVLAVSCSASLFYFLFPHLVVSIFFPAKEYAVLAQYVGLYSVFITIFSLAFLLSNFFLSIGRTSIYKINLICGILLIVCLFIFKSGLLDVIWTLLSMSLVLLASLLIYYFHSYARN